MVKKDLLTWSKPIPAFRLMLSSFLLICFAHTVSSQVQIPCGGSVQVSLDGDCSAVITPDMIIQGNLANFAPPYTVRVSGIVPTVPYSDPIVTSIGNYTVSVTNSQGNSCWGYMKVEDKLAPQVNCACPVGNIDPDCMFKCTDEASFIAGTLSYPRPDVEENCGSFTTAFFDESINTTCGTKKIRRSWIFTDAFGNKSLPCVSEYTFAAVSIADVIPAYNNIQMTCAADVTPAGVFAFFKAKLYAQYRALYLTRVPLIYATNAIAEAAADRDAIFEATKHAWPTINGVPISGQTCNLIAGKSDTELVVCAASCTNSKKIIRIWTILDWCSGTNTALTQIIKATDEEAPTVTGKPVVVTSVDPWTCAANFLMPAPDILHDNCSVDVSYTVEGPNGITITRDAATGRYHIIGAPKGDNQFRYVAKDCCGNEGIFAFIVRVEDRTAPIAIAKQHIVLSLTTGGQGDGIAKLFGNSVDNGSYDSCTPVKIELRRERGSNRDETDCGHTGNFTYNADGHPQDGSTNPLSPSYDDDNGAFVKFCCSDISNREGATPFGIVKVWMRVWDDGDLNGIFGTAGDNYNETWVDVRVEDKLTPKIICPADIVINCDEDDKDFNKVGKATAYSNCLNLETEYTDQDFVNSCNVGYILRTWTIKNRPGITCTQRITKRNPFPQLEATIQWPADITTNCATTNANDKPTWSAGTCDQIGVSLKSDTFYFESGACMKILNKWTVINWCTYNPNHEQPYGYYSHTSIIKVIDDVKPTLGSCNDLMFEINDFGDADADGNRCETKNLMLTKIADDQGQCASAWLKWVAIVDLWGDGKYDYEYSSFLPASDATFDDTNGNGIPDRYVGATGRGGEFKITIPEDITGSMSTHKVIWKVADGCGNITNCTQNFMVVDKKQPTPYCLNVSSALMQNGKVELWAVDFNVGSFDNCTPKDKLLYTLEGEHPVLTKLGQVHFFKGKGLNATEAEYNAGNAQKWLPSKNSSGMIFSCSDLPVVDIKMSVWDEKLNTDFCSVTLNLADNQGACGGGGNNAKADVSGRVSTNNGMTLAGAEVKLNSGIPELTKTAITTVDGQYLMNNALMNYNYEITAAKNDDYLNGVSTLDLVMIQRHVLGLNYFTSAYQTIAGDVNNDQKVSATDLTELRKLILGLYPVLPNNGSWKFINAGQAFADIRNPWPINEAIEIANLNHVMTNQNFISVKVGDVNNTAIGNINENSLENRNVVSLSTDDVMMINGTSQSITFAASADKIHGMQFTLDLKNAKLNDIMIGSKKVGDNNIAQIAPNKYVVSWNTISPVAGQELITINLTPTKEAMVSEIVSINSTSIGSEIYAGDDIKVSKIVTKFSGRTTNNEFEVFQNEPNPFNESTIITFNLPEASSTSLKVYDVNGKLIYTRNGSFGPGMNSFTINKSELPSLGVMMYQIESGQFTVTKKMIGLE
jgi:Secretion system C-terminal sorting domain/Dockerin type I domain